MFRACVVLLLASAAVAAPVPKGLKAKVPTLDGLWQAVSLHSGGTDVVAGNPWVWQIDGEKLTIHNRQPDGGLKPNDPNTVCTLTQVPGQPDLRDYRRKSNGGETVLPGHYTLDGDTLTYSCSNPGSPRPTDFTVGPSYTVIKFKRVEK